MKRIGLKCLIAAIAGLLACPVLAAQTTTPWEQPAAKLAGQIADLLGPGQARMTIRNISSISTDEIPVIRKLLVQELRTRGIAMGGDDSANSVRVTLSESAREQLWVAEVLEGDDSRVAMVELGPVPQEAVKAPGALLLRRQEILVTPDQVLAVLETPTTLVALEPEMVVLYTQTVNGWQEQRRMGIELEGQQARDARGIVAANANGAGLDESLPGVRCTSSIALPASQTLTPADAKIQCRASDDPWTVVQPPSNSPGAPIRAFYNSSRNYFTGVVVPSIGVDLPPFYSIAQLPRAAGSAALLVGGIDGKVQLVENGAVHPVAGTRDWGSDFAALQSGCGTGTQVIVSGSGDAPSDSLRAYELPAVEAVPASEPLQIAGTTMALSTAPDGKSVLAVVRNGNQYEVDRVTALCN